MKGRLDKALKEPFSICDMPCAVVEGLNEWEYIPAPMAVVAKAEIAIRRFGMLNDGNGVVLAVSGGADSVAMMHVMIVLSQSHGYKLHIAHINHKLRGEEADMDAQFVCELSKSFSLPCTIHTVDVRSVAREMGMSIEQAGRAVRYEFLRSLCNELGFNRVALGHTADDVIETVLLNIFRGTGLNGLLGIPPVSDGLFIRPMMFCRRSETNVYCKVNRLPIRVDTTNLDPTIRRNFIRLQLLPLLKERLYQDADTAVFRMVELLRADNELLESITQAALDEALIDYGDGYVRISRGRFLSQHIAIQRRMIRALWQRLQGENFILTMEHIDRAVDLINRRSDRAMLTMPSKCTLLIEGDSVALFKPGNIGQHLKQRD
ncbi:MAG: tRNA lysidine(34) synthetase TilS [Armatimonadota bacterium]|nr:tRNA lysidine(34) synthetase TilS [Armatimonadota bacterium]MCX7776472.1 tRNA lysidine(34) synthetase TilS [Armatimonadota bacterium]MDW8024269.1 tRNA lysidine(34) synthetase TilS [Armatimonadota bacterium]